MSFVRPRDDVLPAIGVSPGSGPKRLVVSSYFHRAGLLSRLIALLLMVPALPIIGVLVCLVRWTSPGAGIYRQTRVGQFGTIFTMYKIRTMRNDAEAETGPVWAQERDPRITPVGRVLRALHLDEFPQLFNVIKGEMNLIGPRPERPELAQLLAQEIPGYLSRLTVPPGITGLAQINLPPDSDLNSVRRKLVFDLKYIAEAGLWLDGRILLRTALRVVGIRGDLVSSFLGLYQKLELPTRAKPSSAAPANKTPAGKSAQPKTTPTAQRIPTPHGALVSSAGQLRDELSRDALSSDVLSEDGASHEGLSRDESTDDEPSGELPPAAVLRGAAASTNGRTPLARSETPNPKPAP